MEFKHDQLYYIGVIGILFCIFSFTQNISQRFEKGKIIQNSTIRRLLWIKKDQSYISYPSIVFFVLGYIYLLSLIPCNIVCMFVSEYLAHKIVFISIGIMGITLMIEVFFLPSYGIKGG